MAKINQAPLNGNFLLSEAEGERSRATGDVKSGSLLLPPGTLVDGNFATDAPVQHGVASVAGGVTGILLYWADPTTGVVRAPFIVRDAEVNEALLIYGALDRELVADQLATQGVIVRRGVLAAPGHTFGSNPATDPALTGTVYGSTGNAAMGPGGIYGTSFASPQGQGNETLPELPDAASAVPPDAPSQSPQVTDRPRPPSP